MISHYNPPNPRIFFKYWNVGWTDSHQNMYLEFPYMSITVNKQIFRASSGIKQRRYFPTLFKVNKTSSFFSFKFAYFF